MNNIIRWGKFNLVGAMGMVVQLAALALFNRWFGGRYLMASAAAIELTLLHNFVWHLHYTWRDRRDDAPWVRQLVRFHLSNGVVSMLGNLVSMRLLVQEARLPLLVANGVAIVCCSMVNFCLGNVWAFAGKRGKESGPRVPVTSMFLLLVLLSTVETRAHGQTSTGTDAVTPKLPSAPTPGYHPKPSDSYTYNAGAFCGMGASASSVSTKPAVGCGAGITFVPTPLFLEVGVMGPQANRSYLSGYISVDGIIPLARSTNVYLPIAIVGYSRLFETGHALDYGLALALPRFGKRKDSSDSLRIELRDYWTFANPAQHNVMLRVGWMSEVND